MNLFRKKKVAEKNVFKTSFFELKNLPELSSWKIPKFEISISEGPVVFLTSGIHGDEIAGNVILMKFCNFLRKNALLKGKVVALIGVNQTGGEKLVREIPETKEDLNRVFGGKVDGTVAERLAYNIREEISKQQPSLVIDLHNDYFFSTPYILLDPRSLFSEHLYVDTAGLAIASGLNVVQERDDEREMYENSLSAYCVSRNIPAITIEGGPDKLILKKHVDAVVEALINILINKQMLPKNFLNKKKKVGILKKMQQGFSVKENRILENGEAVKVQPGGNLQYLKEPGEYVRKGEVLAKLRNEFGENLGKILCPHDAFILGHSEKINVEDGEEIYWLAKV
jgi:hypothetical protein